MVYGLMNEHEMAEMLAVLCEVRTLYMYILYMHHFEQCKISKGHRPEGHWPYMHHTGYAFSFLDMMHCLLDTLDTQLLCYLSQKNLSADGGTAGRVQCHFCTKQGLTH